MRLVIDSNRLVAGILKDSISRRIILNERFEFYSPDYLVVEVKKHEEYLARKGKLGPREFEIILDALLDNIILVRYRGFEDALEEAIEILKNVDITDAPFLAVGMALGLDGIWTEDKHFLEQNRLKVYGTEDLSSSVSGKQTQR